MIRRMSDEPYPPIGDYALLGDMHSCALVSKSGSVDWCCWPRFDSPSVFGRLLDWEKGGHFQLAPRGVRSVSRRYVPGTNVLQTTFETDSGSVQLTDFMPVHPHSRPEQPREVGTRQQIVRAAAGALEDADDLLARAYFARLLGARMGMHRHEVRELDGTGIRLEGCLKDIGARQVAPADRADAARGELEVPALLPIEQPSEHGGAVEAGPAAPVDRTGLRHERAGVHIAQQRVVGDWRERVAVRHGSYPT